MTKHPYYMACDIGGTFTDLVLERAGEPRRFYKRSTTPEDPIIGLLNVMGAAAEDIGLDRRELLGQVAVFVHGTTRATNAVVTGSTARTALLCTKGHPDTLLWREGNDRKPALDYTQEYPKPYIPRSLTFEITERVLADGTVHEALDVEHARVALRGLRERGVEAIAVCLLWSIVNPVHEQRLGELIEEELPGIPFTLSHQLNPSVREYRRASSTAIDASVKPLMSSYFSSLDLNLRDKGFEGRLLSLTGAGGVLDVAEVAEAPIHSIGSGPAAGPVAGRYFAQLDTESPLAIVTDAGGTTYDVSLVRDGHIPWTREMTLGSFPGYALGFPSVDVRSVGAGGGSIGWVDEGNHLHVGPQSAGADPGPAAYGRGGTQPTVTDACMVLGYINPHNFLGGTMTVQPELSEQAIQKYVADPLGISLEEAAHGILTLATEKMVTAIEEITLDQGIDPRKTVMVGGGGGAGLYSVPIARRLGISKVIIPQTASALSASGALMSDLHKRFTRLYFTTGSDFDIDGVQSVLDELRAQGERFGGALDRLDTVQLTFSVEARYSDQVWEIEVPLPSGGLSTDADVAELVATFHARHLDLFAHADESARVEFVSWHLVAEAPLIDRVDDVGEESAEVLMSTHRSAYFHTLGRTDVVVVSLPTLGSGELVVGPALLEGPSESIVLHPGATAERLQSGSILVTLDRLAGNGGEAQ